MRTSPFALPLPLALALVLGACGDDDGPAGPVEDDARTDLADATPDDDVAPDATPEPDVAPDDAAPEDDAEPDDDATDGSDDAADTDTTPDDATLDAAEDAAEDADDADTEDAADADVEDPGAPTCSTSDTCEGERECIAGLCQIPLAGRQIVEDAFAITQPSEVSHVFNIIKDLAVDIRFMMLDVRPEGLSSGRIPARYGSVDLVDTEVTPILVSWQDLPVNPSVLFEPQRDEDGRGDGATWQTIPFDLQLIAFVSFDFAGFGSFSGEIGFDAIDVVLEVTLLEDATQSQLIMRGSFTREEAESRFMARYEDFRQLIPLLCRADRNYVPPEVPGQVLAVRLSDILDCNGAEMNVDTDGDGEMDAYHTEIVATMVPARLVED